MSRNTFKTDFKHYATVVNCIGTHQYYHSKHLNILLVTTTGLQTVRYVVDVNRKNVKQVTQSKVRIGDEVMYHVFPPD